MASLGARWGPEAGVGERGNKPQDSEKDWQLISACLLRPRYLRY